MKRILILLVICVLAFPVTAAEPVPKAIAKPKATTIPFELLKTGHMAVQVKVNGEGPYRLIFDTGAPINLINNKLAKQAGLLKGKQKPLFALFGSMGEVKIKTLEVGGQEISDVDAVVMDHPTVDAMARAVGPLYGIVGFPFFARFRMTLDYQKKTMTLIPNGFEPPNVMRSMQAALLGGLGGSGEGPTVIASKVQWGMTVKAAGDDKPGVIVRKVLAGGAADLAGLKVGDRLLTMDDRWTDTVVDTIRAGSLVKPGESVPLKILRDGKEMQLKVRPRVGF